MILYHGSYIAISKPDLLHSRPYVDFGRGFYTTPFRDQAESWCNRYKRQAIKRLRFEKPNLQYCFRTEKALSALHFDRSEEV